MEYSVQNDVKFIIHGIVCTETEASEGDTQPQMFCKETEVSEGDKQPQMCRELCKGCAVENACP